MGSGKGHRPPQLLDCGGRNGKRLAGGRRAGGCLTAAWGHIEKVVSHPVLNVWVLEGMVVNHDHLIVILFGDRESFIVPVDLVRPEVTEGAVGIDIRNGSQQGLVRSLVFEGNHEQFVVAVGIGEFDTAVHIEF